MSDHIAYPFAIDPGSGTLAREPGYEAYVRSLVLQVLLTAHGERINRPDFGASLRRLVFSPLSAGIETFVQTMVLQALNRWLADVIRVETVAVTVVMEQIEVEVSYLVLARGETHVLSVEVTP